jgi:hypothetical protein
LLLGVILLLSLGCFLSFTLLDQRDPNDHDGYYANDLVAPLAEYLVAEDAATRLGILRSELLERGDYPPVARVSLLVGLGTWGPSRLGFRLINLPFLVLLILGTWLLGRQIGGARVGLVAALLVVGIPSMIVHSRKFAPPWHAAALTPLSWALLFMALRLRGRKGWLAAAGAGFVQGARAYTHPIVYPDIGVSAALVIGWAGWRWWSRRGSEDRDAFLRVGFAGVFALLLASHMLGWGWLGSTPEYSLSNYRDSRAHILSGGLDGAGLFAAAGLYVREWFSMHLLPLGFLLALVGGGAALFRLARRGAGGGSTVGTEWEARGLAGLLALSIFAQAPLALLAVSRGTFTSDWMHLEPAACVLGAWGVMGVAGPLSRRAGLWLAASGLHSVAVLLIPLGLGVLGPSAFDRPEFYLYGPGAPFAHSSSGQLWNTHQIPIREPGAQRLLTETMALTPTVSGAFKVVDVSLRNADAREPCRVGLREGSQWIWGAPTGQDQERRCWSPWPAIFSGVAPNPPQFTHEGSVGAPDWRQAPQLGDPVLVWLESERPPVVVRLWVELSDSLRSEWKSCLPVRPGLETQGSARALLEELLPMYRLAGDYFDLGNELVGLEDGRFRDPGYQSHAFLFVPR